MTSSDELYNPTVCATKHSNTAETNKILYAHKKFSKAMLVQHKNTDISENSLTSSPYLKAESMVTR